ncbi:DgyrCDS6699 [Dimorphilus gyrociliatus]|uniref:DgyrCDS6699 n=1 Tax=Dimorphilus gyrociliatus TaxID=2664684 RepID=A0A7I8VNU0_9ANNE|nr:DgyrCDS6699 [Dimorphilus gyrociliatus]
MGYEAHQRVLLYFDDQWPNVYGKKTSSKVPKAYDVSCPEKESVLKPENNQVINLTTRYAWSGCRIEKDNGVDIYNCSGSRSFKSARERWWFIAVSNCNSKYGLFLEYDITMTNGNGLFSKHFSADEFYILETNMGFLIAHWMILLLSTYVALRLKARQLFHTTYKMYMVSLVCEVLFLFITCIYLGKYANDGLENRGIKTFGRIFESLSTLLFLLMLILMGKGYTITRGRISQWGTIKIAVFMTIYVFVYVGLFIYQTQVFDPGLVLYLYESPAGYGLIGLRLVGWIWFCYAIFFTLKHYPEKSRFYYPFFIFYTLWFLAMPVFALIAYYAIDKWAREKVVNGVEVSIAFLAHISFLILTRPSAANSNFPYHVRTTQIGVMHNAPHEAGGIPTTAGADTDSFPTHSYAPSAADYAPTGGPNFSELFTVSNDYSNNLKTNPVSLK